MQGLFRVLAGLVTLAALPVLAADVPLKERVEARLVAARLVDKGDIQVEAQDGRVVLTGATLTWDARRRAEEAARKEAREVENRIKVVPEPRSDGEVRKDVARAVLSIPRFTVFDAVGATVQGGVVILTGSLYQPFLKDEVEERVGRVAGVVEVRNQIGVQPVSIFDDDLRRELYRAIYRDERLAQYATWAEPPIRILVERGKVRLVGSLSSPVEKALVEHLARGTMNFGVVNQIELESDQPKEDCKTTDLTS